MAEPAKVPPVSAARMNWWIMLAVFAAVFAGVRLVSMLPAFHGGLYAAYAKGPLTKLNFKSSGQPTPTVAFKGPDGETLSLAAFRGKTILVNLWASWCAPCVKELPSLDALQAALGSDKFQVVAINMDAAPPTVARAFLAENKLTRLALYTDRHLLMDAALAGPGIPASVLYDARGREIARYYGALDWTAPEARALIQRAIQESAKG